MDVSPLLDLELRTPRLQLRLGSAEETQALGALAERGIHPMDEMPFAVAWTDAVGQPGFLDDFCTFHREQLAAWSSDDWNLVLLVWEGGELVGSQALLAKGFAHNREVSSGSWLGAAFQGRGIGTEMRTAVLELAFRGLGAESAVSGWLEGNRASARVSEKLGYLDVGVSEISPRGQPVPHHDVRLDRNRWKPPVPVEIVGLERAVALFGGAQPRERSAAPSD
jgi:RimJ/RimL family protein N-acetyltransferase